MKKLSLLHIKLPLILGLIISSCNGKEQAPMVVSMQSVVFIKYSGVDGTNILKNESQIEVYYERNGIAEKVDRPNLDYPNGYTITSLRDAVSDGSDELCAKVFPSDYVEDENISTTYIKLGDYQMDTIRCQFNITSNLYYILKIWHNGKLVWDIETISSSFPLIQITK